MRIEKKVWPQYYQKILTGDKKYELRLADWKCEEGDILILREWDPETKKLTGRVLEKEVSYILKTKDLSFWSEEDVEKYGYQIISFK
jgi:predicted transcriptional regulator